MASDIGEGYKLIYAESKVKGHADVGIVLDKDVRNKILKIERIAERIIRVKIKFP